MNILKPISGNEGFYDITEYGNVWSHTSNRWLNPSDSLPYLRIDLRGKLHSIHRLVALTYIPNPNNFPIVRHLDNNKRNNHVSNLEWCTHKTNVLQAHDDGLSFNSEKQKASAKIQGGLNGKKYCSKPVMQMTYEGILCKIYPSAIEAARQNKCFQSIISKCARGEISFAIGYRWKYLTA